MRLRGVSLLAAAFLLPGLPLSADEFAYSGEKGPAFWGELEPEWAACSASPRQSPIDVRNAVLDRSLGALDLALHPSGTDLVNNGHAIQAAYAPGSFLTWEGVAHELKQFHFHTLSEHTVHGARSPMEMHAVFSDPGTGHLVVVAVLFEPGAENAFLAGFDDDLPVHPGDHHVSADEIDLADGLTDTAAYFTYEGSLTTPPCSPVATFVVLKDASTASEAQLSTFRDILGNNFRPLQPANGRAVRATARGGVARGR